MLSTQIPPKFPIPWGANAGGANIRSIPTPSQTSILAGAASLNDGFPPLNFTPVAAGGIPPFGQDMNGILNQITQWDRWTAMGGPVFYDSSFASSIGGYPKGVQLVSNSGHAIYESVVESNLSDPNGVSSSGWRINSSPWLAQVWAAIGSANIQTVNLSPAPTSLAQLTGIPFWVTSAGTNTGPSTLNPNGFADTPLLTTGGGALPAGALVSGYPYQVIYTGSVFLINTPSGVFNDPGNTGLTVIAGAGNTSGANLKLVGNGSTTPIKYVRSQNGHFAIVNSAYNTEIMNITDAGAMSTPSDIASLGGRLHGALGGTGVTDLTVATTMRDFFQQVLINPASNGQDYIFQAFPSGTVIQAWGGLNSTGADIITFPNAFPTKCLQVMACEGNPNGWVTTGVSAVNLRLTQFGTQQLTATNFALYVAVWDTANKVWGISGGITYRYIAIGY